MSLYQNARNEEVPIWLEARFQATCPFQTSQGMSTEVLIPKPM